MPPSLRSSHRGPRLVTLLACALLALSTRAQAQPAPYRAWRTLETPHFRVHAPAGLEREGRVAGAAAERAYALLARELVPPRGLIDLIVSDDADYSNGSATPFPTNRIIVFATPPIEAEALRLNEDWLGLVITHELTHVFHLDRTRGIWAVGQRVFGRAPFLFPNLYSPAWLTEGLAVYYESRLTMGGRLRDAEHRSLARAAALEGRLPALADLSLGTPRFPGGEGTYAYGSLLLESLAATRGDSSVPRFVERQSGELLPLLQERAAKQTFGVIFPDAFDAWRDSLRRAVGPARAPLTAWRDLSRHPYTALNPRWLNDTTLVYTGTDGRFTNAAYTITTSGARTRLGRRAGTGANVPLANGGLLFAQPEYVGTAEVRSDLYVERSGVHSRLTHGARLVQPDARRGDGAIVAAELAAARSSLVLLDSLGGARRMLREAGPDETWSEPRWSPDGAQLVAIHRPHGGEQRLEVIDTASGQGCTWVRDTALLASPSWVDARTLLYTSERSGLAQVETVSGCLGERRVFTSAPAGIIAVEAGVRGRTVAVVVPQADGYHLGTGTLSLDGLAAARDSAVSTLAATDTASRAQPLATGDFTSYAPWRALAPRYWMPLLESGPDDGLRLGAITSGRDPVARHAYGAYVAIETSGRFATGALSYRYAGLRRPFIDVGLSQDWESQGRITDTAGAALGELLKRTQDLSLAASFVRPRVRTYATLTGGVGLERRRYASDPSPLLDRLNAIYARTYTYPRAFLSASWSNSQRPLLSISPEDGVALAVTARERYRTDDARGTRSTSLVGTASGYRALDLTGFAHHVLALRLAGGRADARASSSFELGGTSGSSVDVAPGFVVGEGRRTFGVRGFPVASVYGTRAAAGSLEYRAPLLLGGKGLRRVPAFFDRSSVSAFADAGAAGCAAAPLYPGVCSPAAVLGHAIASVGAELGLSVAVLQYDAPQLLRVGVALPVAGRALVNDNVRHVAPVSVYVAFGLSY